MRLNYMNSQQIRRKLFHCILCVYLHYEKAYDEDE